MIKARDKMDGEIHKYDIDVHYKVRGVVQFDYHHADDEFELIGLLHDLVDYGFCDIRIKENEVR